MSNLKYRINDFIYTYKHRRSFIKLEKKLLGRNSIRGLLHDIDKYLLYIIFGKKASKIHRRLSRHHQRADNLHDYIQMVIDWECARFTKPDKPLNARGTLYKFYPEMKDTIDPILNYFNL